MFAYKTLPTDKSNGFYDRSLQVGSIPVDIRVPRTRNDGDLRPTSLPGPYRRGYSEEVQSLLVALLASSRSINAAKDALQKKIATHPFAEVATDSDVLQMRLLNSPLVSQSQMIAQRLEL